MVKTYACKNATKVSNAYIKNSKKNQKITGMPVTKSMLKIAVCKKMVVASENTARIMCPASMLP